MGSQDGIRSENMTSHSSTGKKSPFYVNNLNAKYIHVSADMTIFTRTTQNFWETIISSFPMKRGCITEIDTKIYDKQVQLFGFLDISSFGGPDHHFWIGQKDKQVSLGTHGGGYTHSQGSWRPYGPYFVKGDVLTSKIDLRQEHYTVEYLRKGHSLGLAFAGLQNWSNQIHWGASLHTVGSSFEILAIREYKQ